MQGPKFDPHDSESDLDRCINFFSAKAEIPFHPNEVGKRVSASAGTGN